MGAPVKLPEDGGPKGPASVTMPAGCALAALRFSDS